MANDLKALRASAQLNLPDEVVRAAFIGSRGVDPNARGAVVAGTLAASFAVPFLLRLTAVPSVARYVIGFAIFGALNLAIARGSRSRCVAVTAHDLVVFDAGAGGKLGTIEHRVPLPLGPVELRSERSMRVAVGDELLWVDRPTYGVLIRRIEALGAGSSGTASPDEAPIEDLDGS